MRCWNRWFGFNHANQRKVGGTSTDIADEDALPRTHALCPSVLMANQPSIERRLRFFDQDDVGQSRFRSGLDGQSPRNFIERSGQGYNDVLLC